MGRRENSKSDTSSAEIMDIEAAMEISRDIKISAYAY